MRCTYNWRHSVQFYTIYNWLVYHIGTFRIFECHLGQGDTEIRLSNLGENIEICLPLLPSITTLCTILSHNTCSVAWVGKLSAIFILKLKQRSSSYPFSPFSVNFEFPFLVPSDLFPYYCMVGKYSGDNLAKLFHFISSSIIYGTTTLNCWIIRQSSCHIPHVRSLVFTSTPTLSAERPWNVEEWIENRKYFSTLLNQ